MNDDVRHPRPSGSGSSRGGRPDQRRDSRPAGRGNQSGERKPWSKDGKPGERSGKPGERKPWSKDGKPGERSGRSGERKHWGKDGKPGERSTYGDRPERDRDFTPRHDDPPLPDGIEAKDLDIGARAQLKTLSKENAERVAKYLVAAALALDVDPQLALKHAQAAARTAGRIAVVRETVAITAYEAGDFSLALRELRTYRRISGKNDQVALIVDSERGMGRPRKALEEGRAVDTSALPVESRVALAIAMSGARLDLGQRELALAELEIPELNPNRVFDWSPALFRAYAEVLSELDRARDSATWRHRAEVAEQVLDEEYGAEDVIDVFEDIDSAVSDDVNAAPAKHSPEDADA